MEIKRDSLDVLSYAFGIKQGLEKARQGGVISGIQKGFYVYFSHLIIMNWKKQHIDT